MHFAESLRFSWQALRANRVRTLLTALGLVIGNASVILVVTISLTSRDYILQQIQGIGSNLVYAYYEAGSAAATAAAADFVKWSDVLAARRQLAGQVTAATGVETNHDTISINGRPQDVTVIGSDEYYQTVRNMSIIAGRGLDASDVSLRQKVALLTEPLAQALYGSPLASPGQTIKLYGLQFRVIGAFKERVASFGLSELSRFTVLVPITVLQNFTPIERIDPMYVQVRYIGEVPAVTAQVRRILESRHRPGARYLVENLTAILDTAQQIAMILTGVLILVSAIALIISGIGIMNIMLVTVTERTREIGVRMAVGAARRDILQQFLFEAILISVSGGFIGILIGVGIPLSVRYLAEGVQIPVSSMSIVVAFGVSVIVGLIFGLLPASRAARLNPTEALRWE